MQRIRVGWDRAHRLPGSYGGGPWLCGRRCGCAAHAVARTGAKRSKSAWTCSTLSSSAKVRHQGCPANLVDLLHPPLAVPGPRRADLDHHPVILCDRGEGDGDTTGAGVADRGHPVEPLLAGHPAQAPADPVQPFYQVLLIQHGRQVAAPPPGMGHDPTSRCAIDTHPQAAGRSGRSSQSHGVLLTRRMRDERVRRARSRVREPEGLELIAQRAAPEMWVLDQPGRHVSTNGANWSARRPTRAPACRSDSSGLTCSPCRHSGRSW